MESTRSRLVSCFSAVFPGLSADEVEKASVASVASWDSMAAVNLLTIIEEEFGIMVAGEELDQIASFELTLAYLEQRLNEQ